MSAHTHVRVGALAALVLAAAASGPALAGSPGVPAFVIDGGTVVSASGTTRLVLDCNLLAVGTFAPAPGATLVLVGYGSPVLAGTPTLAGLTLALHGTAAIAQPTLVSGSLSLQSGWVWLGGYDLTAPIVSGGSAASYVVTPDTLGRLVRPVDAGTNALFPVGGSRYDPVTLRTGTGADAFRVAVFDTVPPAGIPAGAGLLHSWAIAQSSPHSTGPTTAALQWNVAEQGAQFDRSFGLPTSAVAYRWLGAAWLPQPGVRRTDNGLDPPVDTLVVPDVGLWTLASPAGVTAVGPALPVTVQLAPPEPHPVRGGGLVRYGLPREAGVSLTLYDLAGARRLVLADGRESAGWHVARLDASRVPDGVYFLRLVAGRDVRTARCVVLR
ncbi:MAG TPA: hypothetical protein VGU27_04315 [Candidatus Eisenbacteria bacterium]|nr:hypothetical protein [Candidatus Eisenbacteria bacterium]